MLLLEGVVWHPTVTDKDFEYLQSRCEKHPFYRYASVMWPVFANGHFEDATVSSLVLQLFDPRKGDAFCSWCLEFFLFSHSSYALMWRGTERPVEDETPIREKVVQFSSQILQNSFTPLHMAAGLGLYRVCQKLLERGADCDAPCDLGSPLHCAVSPTWMGTNRPLCYLAANIGPSARYLFEERAQVVELLIRNGADMSNAPSSDLDDELLFSSRFELCESIGNLDMILALVEGGIVLHQSDLESFKKTEVFRTLHLR